MVSISFQVYIPTNVLVGGTYMQMKNSKAPPLPDQRLDRRTAKHKNSETEPTIYDLESHFDFDLLFFFGGGTASGSSSESSSDASTSSTSDSSC